MGKTLIIVPTAGNETVFGELWPKEACRLRLDTAVEALLLDYAGSDLAIVGGARASHISEADVADRHLHVTFPTFHQYMRDCGSEVIVLAPGTYSARDMTGLADFIGSCQGKYSTLVPVTHPDHAEYLEETLAACSETKDLEYTSLPSGESAPYGWTMKQILRLVYKKDPKWEKWQSWPLRCLANRRQYQE